MDEDAAYRASSQYRLWSFTPSQLLDRRTETNRFAAEKVRAAFARANANNSNDRESSPEGKAAATTIKTRDPLTVDEEQVIVQWGCSKIIEMKDHLDPRPSSVIIATAIQYLRRFYLYNSPMTYHPTQIMLCALFLAMKAEHMYFSLSRFTTQLSITSEDDVRAPEFLLMQALRFTLDVRHPKKGLEGCIAEIKRRSTSLSVFQKSKGKSDIEGRISKAFEASYGLLTRDVQLTDAYFLYTPPQIYLAALYISDQELTLSYLDDLLSHPQLTPMKAQLLDTIKSCATLIQTHKTSDASKAKAEEKRVAKKLRRCQDPEKTDIVAVAEKKRSGKVDNSEGESDEIAAAEKEKKAKKRRIEKEKTLERDGDVFGGDLR